MPNHIHLIWEMKEMNGKETPVASFNKYTSHAISKSLKEHNPNLVESFLVDELDWKIRVWQRDPLAILLDSKKKLSKKLNIST